ncbi:winged helix-turn-helix transcriptional regulator [Candidatus Woesearchaeota archaeon]|nr:winged helix-turn-helix transcriptional regulator [Candidatus Woesearchaeota archaeon]
MKESLTEKSRLLLNMLRKNSRLKKSEIASAIGIKISSVSTIMESIEKDLEIRYVSLVDYRQIGHSIRNAFIIEGKDENDGNVLEFLRSHENINSLHRIEGGLYLADVIFRSMKDMADFTEAVSDCGGRIKKEYYIVEELKREEFEV